MGFTPKRPWMVSPRHLGASVRDQGPEHSVTVAPGDCLWTIAADHLGPDATDWEIAHHWPRWHQANLSVIGDDPAALAAGTVLSVPTDPIPIRSM